MTVPRGNTPAARDAEITVFGTANAAPQAIRGSISRVLGYGAGVLLGLFSVPLLVRHLGVEGYGQYVLITSLVTIATGLTEFGLGAVAVREYSVRSPAERERLLRQALGLRLILGTGAIVGATAFAIWAQYSAALVAGTILAGTGLMLVALQTIVSAPLSANLRLGRVAVVDLIRQSAVVATIIALVAAGASLLPFLAAQVPAALLALGITWWLVRHAGTLRPDLHVRGWWEVLGGTIAYAAATALYVAYLRSPLVAMSVLSSPLQTGYFGTPFRLVEILLAVPVLLVGAFFPLFARAAQGSAEEFRDLAARVLELAAAVGLWFVLILEIGAGYLIGVVAGEGFGPSVSVLRILAPLLLCTFVAMAVGFPLLSLRRHRDLLAANAAALATSVSLAVLLIPRFEARGAAVATLAAGVALAVTQTALLVRAIGRLRVSSRVLGSIAFAGVLGGLVVLIPGLHDVARLAGATGVYFLTLTVLGAIPAEVRRAIGRRGGASPER